MLGLYLIDNLFELIGMGFTLAIALHLWIEYRVRSKKPRRKRIQMTRLIKRRK